MEPKILFVEDDPDDVFLIERAWKTVGMAVPLAFQSTGRAAIDFLSAPANPRERPRVIFLDLNMPVMGGLDFLRWLRKQPLFQHLPVIILTTSVNPQDIKAAYEAGANAFLVKPTSVAQFAEMLSCAARFWLHLNRAC